jgi:positive regulator of sigma E activity
MKPNVPETGKVIKLEKSNAVIMLEGGKSCKGCGAAKIGLCRAGNSSMFLTAKNTAQAKQGDQVIIGIDKKTQRLGYILAYLIPLSAFIGGAIIGSFVGERFAIAALDVLLAFVLLVLSAAFSFRKLRELDRSHQMEVIKIISAGEFTEFIKTEEERRYLHYSNQC